MKICDLMCIYVGVGGLCVEGHISFFLSLCLCVRVCVSLCVCVCVCVCVCSVLTSRRNAPHVWAAQQRHPHGHLLVPGLGQEAQVTRHDGRLEGAPRLLVAVHIPLKHLMAERRTLQWVRFKNMS